MVGNQYRYPFIGNMNDNTYNMNNHNKLSFAFSLTIADIMLILDSVLQKSIVQHFQQPPEWYNKTYPYIWHPLKGISLSATIFMVISVSAERFRAVCHPMSRKHVSTCICLIDR